MLLLSERLKMHNSNATVTAMKSSRVGNVTIREREDVHATCTAAGMSNGVPYSHTGDV